MRVKTESVAAFMEATVVNAIASRSEPGIALFDLLQSSEDPTSFVLVEVYRTQEAPIAHKETAHYQKWRDTVAEMMAEPRKSYKLRKIDR